MQKSTPIRPQRRFPGLRKLSSGLPRKIDTVSPRVRRDIVESMLSSKTRKAMRTYGIWPITEVRLPVAKAQRRTALSEVREAAAEMNAALAHVERIIDPARGPRTRDKERIAHYTTNAFAPLVLKAMLIKGQLGARR